MIKKASRLIIWASAMALVFGASPASATEAPPFSFGDDSSPWSNDDVCDDPRFTGEGVAEDLLVENIGRDASDCSTAWVDLKLQVNPYFLPIGDGRSVNFGENSGEFANDGNCDDVRFLGDHSAGSVYLVEDVGNDAADCRAAFEASTVRYQGDELHPVVGQRFIR